MANLRRHIAHELAVQVKQNRVWGDDISGKKAIRGVSLCINKEPLVEGRDFTIDYDLGRIHFIGKFAKKPFRKIAKRIAAIVILSALCVSSAFARIGETEAQIEQRYGKSVGVLSKSDEPLTKAYASAGFDIVVGFLEGKSHSEMFFKKGRAELSDVEVKTLLEANADGQTWIEKIPGRSWELTDRRAQYHPARHAFIVRTRRYDDADDKSKKAKLKNF